MRRLCGAGGRRTFVLSQNIAHLFDFVKGRIWERRKELARRCGVSRQTVNAIENNKYAPALTLAFRLAKALRLTVDALFRPPRAL